jgi:dTDP-4-amino-4,6-dideoxygalactose transaminase
MKPFLPFVRPSIDEASIAAAADVFRSGQLASGPKVHSPGIWDRIVTCVS